MDIAEAVAKRIEALCEERNISINKLATLSGLTQSTIDSILKGKSRNPRLSTIKKICSGLGISLKDFLDDPIIENADVD
jgi:transcriptional regulator with XRE-family HTH domain